MKRNFIVFIVLLSLSFSVFVEPAGCQQTPQTLLDTVPLTGGWDFAVKMVAGIDAFLMNEIGECVDQRSQYWDRDFSSPEDYVKSVEPNRQHFKTIIGVVDQRQPVELTLKAPVPLSQKLLGEDLSQTYQAGLIGEGEDYKIYAVRWKVLEGVDGEGLLLEPDQAAKANVVALPDCDSTPEMLARLVPGIHKKGQFARCLAENSCRVLIPLLMDRRDTYSGIPAVRMTNQPHREFIYRAAYEMGRHIIGYEVQKILAAVDWFVKQSQTSNLPIPIGVMGYGEGGLLALYAGAIDKRIDVTAVSGYFQPREQLWREPIYRNVWTLLQQFGDAEIASLIAPRHLIIEACDTPEIEGPPQTPNRRGGAPGVIKTPEFGKVKEEFDRATSLVSKLEPSNFFTLINNMDGYPGDEKTLTQFLNDLGIDTNSLEEGSPPALLKKNLKEKERFKRQFDQLVEHTQYLMRQSEFTRKEFWSKADDSSLDAWIESCRWYRDYFWDEIIGKLEESGMPFNAKTRLVYDEPKYKGYEVVLDVYPEVFAYGILLVPKNIESGERRPVVVCQHGLEGRPQHVADPGVNHQAYNQYACKLAEEGFVTYAPQNPYIGQDEFRVLLRKAQPLKLTLFSFIVRQHEKTLNWLASLPFVDAERIGFYGLSYGGKTAIRIPPLVKRYCLSICSADYNEWIWKNVSSRHRYSYLITGEYDMPEFNLGNTFNYAEMSWLILPRPFMVERGHFDGVAPDKWVAYEYARTRKSYDLLGIGNRTEIEFFTGPHSIHGVGTFQFLRKHLNWPE